MSVFADKIYALTKKIPRGKVVTYGQLAVMVGSPRAGRAVGMLMKLNSDAPQTPCHRVVASDGSLTGYSGDGGVETKRKMLESEGVVFIKNKVDLKVCLWK